jgi:hypothetical protein
VDEPRRGGARRFGQRRRGPRVGPNRVGALSSGQRGEHGNVGRRLRDLGRHLRCALQCTAEGRVMVRRVELFERVRVGAVVVVRQDERAVAQRSGLRGDAGSVLPVVRDARHEAHEPGGHRGRERRG